MERESCEDGKKEREDENKEHCYSFFILSLPMLTLLTLNKRFLERPFTMIMLICVTASASVIPRIGISIILWMPEGEEKRKKELGARESVEQLSHENFKEI